MRTYSKLTAVNYSEIRNPERKHFLVIFALSILFLIGFTTSTNAQRADINVNVELPSWAPYYENANLVRYYYFPDIECYYDIRNREFIYLEDGQWMFGQSLPPVYSWFDLNNCFIVALNASVFEPWRHFHYYVAHYPRYYYRSFYRDIYRDHSRPLRGFNENERNVVFNRRSEAENNSFNGRNNSRKDVYNGNENRQRNEGRNNSPARSVTQTHPSEPMNYYGKHVGRPVKVERQMKESRGAEKGRGHRNRTR